VCRRHRPVIPKRYIGAPPYPRSTHKTFSSSQLRASKLRATVCSKPPYMYVSSVRSLAKSLAAELDVLRTTLEATSQLSAKLLNI
jgi:hypothetical protein